MRRDLPTKCADSLKRGDQVVESDGAIRTVDHVELWPGADNRVVIWFQRNGAADAHGFPPRAIVRRDAQVYTQPPPESP